MLLASAALAGGLSIGASAAFHEVKLDDDDSGQQPRGTMVIVSVFGALLVAGWLLFFFGLFVPRNTP